MATSSANRPCQLAVMPIRLRPHKSAKARAGGGADRGSAPDSPYTKRTIGSTAARTCPGSSPTGPSNQSSNGKNQNIQSDTNCAPSPRASGWAYPASRSNLGPSRRRSSSSPRTIPVSRAHRRLRRRISSTCGLNRAGQRMVNAGPTAALG